MRILRRPQFVELDKLEAGTGFLFGSWESTDVGIVVQLNNNQRGVVVPKPSDPNRNGVPIVLHTHEFLNEAVMALPDALIRLPDDVSKIRPLGEMQNFHPGSLIATQDGLLIQATYRHANLYFFDITSGHVKKRPLDGFAYETWELVESTSNGHYSLIKSFGRDHY